MPGLAPTHWTQLCDLLALINRPEFVCDTPPITLPSNLFASCEVRIRRAFNKETLSLYYVFEWRLTTTPHPWKPLDPDMHPPPALAILHHAPFIMEKIRARRLEREAALNLINTVPIADRIREAAPGVLP